MFATLTTVCHLYGDYLAELATSLVSFYWPVELMANSQRAPSSGTEQVVVAVEGKNAVDYYYNSRADLAVAGAAEPYRRISETGRGLYTEQSECIRLYTCVAWLAHISEMSMSLLLVAAVILILMLSAFYIPLPPEICDRKKIHLVELGLRIANEHIGNLVELLAGVRARNRLTRLLCALPFHFKRTPPKWCSVQNVKIAGISCRVYLPLGEKRKSDGAIIFIHGGGYCIMRPPYYDGPLYSIIARVGCPVISIDYQLSPEARFPSAIEECERVVTAINKEKHVDFGIDPTRLALMGDSAGGNLCAVLCQRALRRGEPMMAKEEFQCQVLIYPFIHCFDFLSPSYRYYYERYNGTALLHPTMLARWLLMYIGVENISDRVITAMLRNEHSRALLESDDELKALLDHSQLPITMLSSSSSPSEQPATDSVHIMRPKKHERHPKELSDEIRKKLAPLLTNPDFCPILGKNLEDLPAAMVCTVGIDILRDEGILYAKRLRQFGVPVQWNHYESAFHGIFHMPASKQRKQLLDDIAAYLRQTL